MSEQSFIRQGWQCPKCQSILSPDTTYCIFCAQAPKATVDYIPYKPWPYNPLFGPLYTSGGSISCSNNNQTNSSITYGRPQDISTPTMQEQMAEFWEESSD